MVQQVRAARSEVIRDLGAMLQGQHIKASVEVAGVTWELRTLSPRDMFEADALIAEASQTQAVRSLNRARVSFAVSAINGRPLTEHFLIPSGISEEDRKLLEDPDNRRIWTHTELYRFLMEDGQDELFAVLLRTYEDLLKRKSESIAAIPGFSKGTTSGASSPT